MGDSDKIKIAIRLKEETKDIPNGPYCYEIIDIEHKENGMPIIKIKRCPYSRRNFDGNKHTTTTCALMDVTWGPDDADSSGFSDDADLKICGINED